jgi:hypothetical protein
MFPGAWQSNSTTINIEMISPKQLIGECLDLGAIMLRQVIEVYCANCKIEFPFVNQVGSSLKRKATSQPLLATLLKIADLTRLFKVDRSWCRFYQRGFGIAEVIYQDMAVWDEID